MRYVSNKYRLTMIEGYNSGYEIYDSSFALVIALRPKCPRFILELLIKTLEFEKEDNEYVDEN